jgi:hypothetical protein
MILPILRVFLIALSLAALPAGAAENFGDQVARCLAATGVNQDSEDSGFKAATKACEHEVQTTRAAPSAKAAITPQADPYDALVAEALAQERAEIRATFGARMYIDCTIKKVSFVDDGRADEATVAAALRDRCADDFRRMVHDRNPLDVIRMLASLQPTVIDVVKTHRKARQPTSKAPPKPLRPM